MNRSQASNPSANRGDEGTVKQRLDAAARGRLALPVLFAGSVLEASILPWPIEFPMLAYMLRGKRATVEVVAVCVLGSVVGGLLFYAAGRAAFSLVEGFVMARPALEAGFTTAQGWVEQHGALAVAAATLAPVPVQMASLAAGLSDMAVWAFVTAVAAGRLVRYGAMGAVVIVFGARIIAWWRDLPVRRRRRGAGVLAAVFVLASAWALYSAFATG